MLADHCGVMVLTLASMLVGTALMVAMYKLFLLLVELLFSLRDMNLAAGPWGRRRLLSEKVVSKMKSVMISVAALLLVYGTTLYASYQCY